MMYSKFSAMFTLYHTTTGLTVPPSDGTNGGDAKYDIYISGNAAGNGVYGWVMPETNIGDNPNSTSLTEIDACSSFMVMRNNYDNPIFGNDPNIALSVTAAHEYMHAIQNGYAVSMDKWFKEICATWSEEFAFPGYDDNFQYLMQVFGKPDVALNLPNADGSDHNGHWYGAFIFAQYLTEQTDNSIMKYIYERCITDSAIDAIDNELTEYWGSSFDEMFLQFVIANVLMTNNSGFAPFTYNRASDYETYIDYNGGFVFENGSSPINYTGTPIVWNSQTNGNDRLMRLSSDYFTVTSDRNFKITFNATTTEAGLILVKVNTNSVSFAFCDANESINVTDQSNWLGFVPIVVRFDKDVVDTNPLDYTLTFGEATAGIENIASKISIFPNPTSDFVNVIIQDFTNYEITLIDMTGKKIINQEFNNQKSTIDVSNLENGIYFLQIINNKEVIKTEKIVISH